jgi:hypothetical protein
MYSSQTTPRTNLNCGILNATIILSHSSENCSHEVFNSHDPLFSNYESSTVVSHLELTRKRASVSPINPWSDMQENAPSNGTSVVASLLNSWRHCWRGHVTLPHSCVIQVFIAVASQQTRQGDARRGDARLVTARLGLARRKHRFFYCCVIVGACFDVTYLHGVNTPHCSLLKAIRPE